MYIVRPQYVGADVFSGPNGTRGRLDGANL